jgi:myosin heavy subunit
MRNETSASKSVATAREAVRDAVQRLEPIRADLLKLVEDLPLPPTSQSHDDLTTLSGLTELDAVIRCALHDHLNPLLASLQAMAREPA